MRLRTLILLAYLINVFVSAEIKYGVFGDRDLFLASLGILGGYFVVTAFMKKNYLKKHLFILMVLMLFFTIVNFTHFGIVYPEFIMSLVIQFGFGLALINNRVRWIFMAYSSFLFFQALRFVVMQLDLNTLMVWSRNTVSVYAIGSFIMYYLARRDEEALQSRSADFEALAMAVLTFATCVLAVGRGGIVASGVLLVSVAVGLAGARRAWVLLVPVIGVIGYAYRGQLAALFEQIYGYTKFGIVGLETPRYEFFTEYLQALDLRRLVFGTAEREVSEIFWLGGAHNSYILTHMHMGIGVLVIIYLVAYTVIVFGRLRKPVLLGSILALSIRAFTDTHLIRGNYVQFGIIVALFGVAMTMWRNRWIPQPAGHRMLPVRPASHSKWLDCPYSTPSSR